MKNICIAVDAMGGDKGPKVVVPAALHALTENKNLRLILVGDRQSIEQELLATDSSYAVTLDRSDNLIWHESRLNTWDDSRLKIKHTSQVVAMDESPAHALKNKKDSSMRVAINLIQDGSVHACISAGNTGALMATARFVLKMLPGIDRPAIMFPLPAVSGTTYVLDLGANVDCTAEHLYQFAVMGAILVSAVENKPNPSVGLLNIGAEDIKGTEQVKVAAQLLQANGKVNYFGFVEGNDIYKGTTDVVVCDGFAGNVALKASEGLAHMMLKFAKQEFTKNWYTKFAAIVAKPVLKALFSRFDPNNYNGGTLLGLQGVVVKSHGGANVAAFAEAIRVAAKEVEKQVPTKIRESMASKMEGCEIA